MIFLLERHYVGAPSKVVVMGRTKTTIVYEPADERSEGQQKKNGKASAGLLGDRLKKCLEEKRRERIMKKRFFECGGVFENRKLTV